MARRGWLPGVDSLDDIEAVREGLLSFYGVSALSEIPASVLHSAKKTNEFEEDTADLIAWVGRAKQISRHISLPALYRPEIMDDLLTHLKKLLKLAENVSKTVDLLAEYGIRLVFVEKLKSSKIDGACFWLSDAEPVIAMSLRFDRIDNFWYVLRHELHHVSKNDGKTNVGNQVSMRQEQDADEAYVRFIDPEQSIADYLRSNTASYDGVAALSQRLGIHQGLVAGQIQHQTHNYALFRTYLEPIRKYIISFGKNVDGWSHVMLAPAKEVKMDR